MFIEVLLSIEKAPYWPREFGQLIQVRSPVTISTRSPSAHTSPSSGRGEGCGRSRRCITTQGGPVRCCGGRPPLIGAGAGVVVFRGRVSQPAQRAKVIVSPFLTVSGACGETPITEPGLQPLTASLVNSAFVCILLMYALTS